MSRGAYLAENHRWGQRMGSSELVDTVTGGLTDPFDDYPMGITAENVAEKWGISREEQDALAVESHRRAAQAAAGGYFKEQILPVEVKIPKGHHGQSTTTNTSERTPTSSPWPNSVRSSRRTAP